MDAKLCDNLTILPSATLQDIEHIVRTAAKAYALPYAGLALPMSFFERNEKEIRRWTRAQNRRCIFRGPRNQTTYVRKCYTSFGQKKPGDRIPSLTKPSMTRRENAVAVVLH
jgi:hypothetical protein